jgi:hypothetical protein
VVEALEALDCLCRVDSLRLIVRGVREFVMASVTLEVACVLLPFDLACPRRLMDGDDDDDDGVAMLVKICSQYDKL